MTGRGRPPIGPDVHIRLPADLKAGLEEYARQNDMPLAELCRLILTDWYNSDLDLVDQ
jgi:hypothetical protein